MLGGNTVCRSGSSASARQANKSVLAADDRRALVKSKFTHTFTHTHIQPQSHGLCGATKATKTQELIIVIAADSGTRAHSEAHSYGQTQTEQPGNLSPVKLSMNPNACRGFVSMHFTLW